MTNTNTNSFARVIVREATNQTKIHEYTPVEAQIINNGRKKPDELHCRLSMSNRADISDTIHYVEDVADLTYCDAIWNFQMSARDERGYNYDPSKRAYNSIECNGVLAGDNCFVNGLQYTATNGTKSNYTQFDMSGTDEQTAADLMDSINNDTRIPTLPFDIVGVLGTGVDADKINLYALPAGTAGNSITLTSNEGTRLTLNGGTFSGGTDGDLPDTRFSEPSSGKFQGNYQLDFTLTGQRVTIPIEGQAYQAGGGVGIEGRWSLKKQFDINIWVSPSNVPGISNSTPVIWSQYNGTYGLDIGIYEDGTTGNWYLRVRYNFGSGETILLGTTAKVFEEGVTDSTPRHIRVCRGADNVIRLFAMGQEDATASGVVASSLENPAGRNDMYFGADHTNALEFAGALHQIKLYSGATTTEAEFIRNVGAKAQPIHMKFGGKVWDKKDQSTTKKISAQSYAKDLNDFKITLDAITKAPTNNVSRGAVGGKDAYYTGNFSPPMTADPTVEDFALRDNASIQNLYVIATTANEVNQYELDGNTYNLSSAHEFATPKTFSVNGQDTQPKGISVRASGDDWYMIGSTNNRVYWYKMGTPYLIETSTYQSVSYDFSAQTTSPQAVHVNAQNMYIIDSTHIYHYTLSTSWNPSTATFQNSYDVSGLDNSMRGMDVDINGEHIYLVGTENDKLYHLEMSTANDLTTIAPVDDFDSSTEISTPKGIIYTGSADVILVLDGDGIAYKYQQRSQHAFSAANRYGAGEMDDIIRDLLNNLDPTFIVRVLSTLTMPDQWTGTFLADGTFSEVANLLLVRGNHTWYINARKVMIIEKAVEFGTNNKTNHQFYQVDPTVNTKTTGGQNLGGTAGVFHSYKISAVEKNDGKLINEITLLGARDQTGTVAISNNQIVQEGDSVHSLRINVPQLGNATDLANVRDAILNLSNNVKPQYKVEAPINVHHVRFNHLVKIFNEMIGINGDTLGYMKVESIESNYPSGKTIITVNEFPINFFELARTETSQVNGLQSDTAIPVVFLSADLL